MNTKTLAVLLMSGLLAGSVGYTSSAFADDSGNGDDQAMQQGSDNGSSDASADSNSDASDSASDSATPDAASGDDDF